MKCIEKNVVPSVMPTVCCISDCVEKDTLTWNQCCLLQTYYNIKQMLLILRMCQFYYSHCKVIIITDSNHCNIAYAYYRTAFSEQIFLNENVSVVDLNTLDTKFSHDFKNLLI